MASKWCSISNKKRWRQYKRLTLKTSTLSLCCTKTRFSSSLMVSASFIFKSKNTRPRTWGRVRAVRERERDDSKREQEWDSRRMRGARASSAKLKSLFAGCGCQPTAAGWHPPLKGKTLIREQWGGDGEGGAFFLSFSFFFFFLWPFSLWCSRSATILLPHTTCRLQRNRLTVKQKSL